VVLNGELCSVVGWSSSQGGTAIEAEGTLVEDSGGAAAVLVQGGDWGVRVTKMSGGFPFYEPYLLLAPGAVVGWLSR
jgi:hypothetical protein